MTISHVPLLSFKKRMYAKQDRHCERNIEARSCRHVRSGKAINITYFGRSQWHRRLRRRSMAARLLEIVGSNPTGGMDVCCECCVLPGRGLYDGLIIHPEESYRLWRVVVCDIETS